MSLNHAIMVNDFLHDDREKEVKETIVSAFLQSLFATQNCYFNM